MRAFLALAVLPCAASAQLVPRAAPRALPALSAMPRIAAPAALLPAPSLAPLPLAALTLAPALAAPADAPRPVPAAAFARLVDELMGPDRERAGTAAAELRRLKDAHLNGDPAPEKTPVLGLKPMQLAAGMISVAEKADELRDMKPKKAGQWLKDNSVPVIEDYKGRKRPVDHHHEARAAWEAGHDEVYAHRYLDDELHGRLKALPKDRFYAVAKAMGLLYDRDQFGGGPHGPDHMPETVRSLADDPYRSVAWKVRKRGGFEKTAVPFAEFAWADYFRARLKTYPTAADFDSAVDEALALAHDPAARGLPGWTPR